MNFRYYKVLVATMAILLFGNFDCQGEPVKKAKHADKSIPEIPLPHFEGERYEAEVPDTLDLAERAELAIHAITRMVDPNRDYALYATARFNRRPPVIVMSDSDGIDGGACVGKLFESLLLLRIMSGSTDNLEIDKGWMQSRLDITGEDGIVYWLPSMIVNANYPAPFEEPYGSVESEGRHILALSMWYQHDKNPLWRRLIEKKVQRLTELAVKEEDYAYFTNRPYLPSSRAVEVMFTAKDTAETVKDASGGRGRFENSHSAHQVNFMLSRSLCVAYKLTGYEPALELAGKMIRGVLEHSKIFDQDGRWLDHHFHTSAASLLAILEYAMVTKDNKLLEFAKKGYEYGKVIGDPLVGFFPELVPGSDPYIRRHIMTCETCEVADMIGLSLKLTLAGVEDYWEDVDRWVRNQFVENQLTSVDWVDKLSAEAFQNSPVFDFDLFSSRVLEEKPVEAWESTDIERAIGAFAVSALPNDWGVASSHYCCTGNAGRTLYWIWDSILMKQDGKVQVNLLLNRSSPWLDVNSHLPYEGKVELKIKEAEEVAVRIPEWTDRQKVSCKVNGQVQEFSSSGNYVEVGNLKRDDHLTVEFPMREKTFFQVISGFPYKLTLKGNTVVDIDPKGKINPIYQRDQYKQEKAPLKKVIRFVSRETILW